GLAETHQTLIQNGLRSRVVIETDGKLMSGRDVAIAALLGAEEFGFATAPLITMGCAMMLVCNLDTCPFGVATQNSELRKRFTGKPEYVENFMRFIAQELREYMARLGVRSIEEMCGRTDLLKLKEKQGFKRASIVDLSRILEWKAPADCKTHFDSADVFNFELEKTVDEKILLGEYKKVSGKGKGSFSVNVTSTDRTLGTILGSEIQKQFGSSLADDSFTVNASGGGGQSFGAFIPKGLTLRLTGDANDYFGKGLSGGKLVLKAPAKASYKAEDNIIVGNVALFGATSGKAFINGIAGERFCVRNSGAVAVAEGCGDHGLEYMTGGTVVILGETGRNFAAGMSGGTAFVLDQNHDLYKRLNKQLVTMTELSDEHDAELVKKLISEHVQETGSARGKEILAKFDEYACHFKKIVPNDYHRMLVEISRAEERGLDHEEAVLEAFYETTGQKRLA
ncbi:MAG: glutamate synthase subunit alpha, partial [Treponema sp.]|nr:glutamate synthase subunit alpha [Treponema sp.]